MTAPARRCLLVVLALLAAGCSLTTTRVVHRQVTLHGAPSPTVRVVKRLQTVRVGTPVELLHAQRVNGRRLQVALAMKAGRPSVSHTALSSYAYPPAHGSYLTFTISIRNRGQVPVLVKPTEFSVDVGPGETHVTSYDGNAPYSGAHQQLDAVALQPGQAVRKPLTYDVSAVHGTLTYAPEGKPAVRWRF